MHCMYTVLSHELTVRPGKPWRLEISQECLLCYDQSQQRSGHANWPQNHKLTNVLACGLVFPRLIGFSLARQFQKYFWCSRFSRFDCNISFQDLFHTQLYGNERAKWTIKMRNSFLFLQQVQKPCDVGLFGNLLLCLVRSKLFLKN